MNARPFTPLQRTHADRITADAAALLEAERQLWASVADARTEARMTWDEIGRCLNVTRSAAQQRFSKPPRGALA